MTCDKRVGTPNQFILFTVNIWCDVTRFFFAIPIVRGMLKGVSHVVDRIPRFVIGQRVYRTRKIHLPTPR
jgi:hypothetical protein